MGKGIERNYLIKEYLIKQSDEKLNTIVHSVSKLDLKEFSTLMLIKELLKANPKLLVELGALAASLR
jgi:digeranylgeranylglycerophospholipid reductase